MDGDSIIESESLVAYSAKFSRLCETVCLTLVEKRLWRVTQPIYYRFFVD